MWSRQPALRVLVIGVLLIGGNLAFAAPVSADGAPSTRASVPTPPSALHRPSPAPARPAARKKVSVSHKRTAVQKVRRWATTQPAPTAVPAAPSGCEAVVAGIAWPPKWQVRCAGARPGILGLTDPAGITTLYVRPGQSSSFLRVVALHEAGHAWDFARLDPGRISRWCGARGCDAAHFFSGGASGPGWHEPGGAEDWAASWDYCHGGEYHRSYLGFGPPTADQCALQNTLTGL
jgi:hypothetical protein